MKSLFSSTFFLNIRNNLNFRISGYYSNIKNIVSVSDFFYWDTRADFDTKLNITNIASQVLPEINQNCDVILIFYFSNGKEALIKHYTLKQFESVHINVSSLIKENYGSLAIFHQFESRNELINLGSYVTEKGYVGYKFKNNLWSYVHGNNSALALTINQEVKPLLAKTILSKNIYFPQVSFLDVERSSIIFNNPTDSKLKTIFFLLDKNLKIIKKIDISTDPFCTQIINLFNENFAFIKIKSNIVLFRPIIKKYYKNYFDIFHG